MDEKILLNKQRRTISLGISLLIIGILWICYISFNESWQLQLGNIAYWFMHMSEQYRSLVGKIIFPVLLMLCGFFILLKKNQPKKLNHVARAILKVFVAPIIYAFLAIIACGLIVSVFATFTHEYVGLIVCAPALIIMLVRWIVCQFLPLFNAK